MAYSSVADIIGVIKRLDLEDENYGSLISDLSALYGSLNVDDIEKNYEQLLKYSASKKIKSVIDRSFLTINQEERDNIIESFENLPDKDVKVSRLMFFKFGKAISNMKEKINYCIEHNVDYKDENNILFEELFFLSLEEIKEITTEKIQNETQEFNHSIYEEDTYRRNGQR